MPPVAHQRRSPAGEVGARSANRRELNAAKARADSYLEVLRTRDWRGGFNQNLFREWDDQVDAARSGHGDACRPNASGSGKRSPF